MSKSRRHRVRELVEELISLGYQFYPTSHGLFYEEMMVEDKFGNSPELKFALDRRKRIQLGIPRGQSLGYTIYPTEKLRRVLDKLEVRTGLLDPCKPNVKLFMPMSKVAVPRSWFSGRFSHSMEFSSRAGVRSWLRNVKHYLLEMNDPLVINADRACIESCQRASGLI